MCEAWDIAIAPHCPLGSIALAACFQVAACTPNHTIQEMSLGIHYNVDAGEEDIGTYLKDNSVFDIQGGFVEVSGKPGLGIEIDEEVIRTKSKDAKPWRTGGFFGEDGSIREW